ncbi:YciI family protein [Nocardia sp. NPDC057030]|uniref:YciI family protein n=1 Tax=unclassified Nocardia TaxID=2637762 RepID=UPI003636D3CB
MKYMLMIYQNPAAFEALSKDEMRKVMDEATAIWQELKGTGEFVSGEALANPLTSKTVRVRNGVPAVTDGPYLESKEQLAGYLVIECTTEQRAIDIAARWPDAKYWAMEVRPVMHGSGVEM